MDESWSRHVAMAVTVLLMGAINAWLVRARRRSAGVHPPGVLRHTRAARVLAVSLFAVLLSAAVAAAITLGRQVPGLAVALLVMAAVTSLPVLDCVRGWHELVPGGMRYGKLFASRGQFTWSDVRRLRYSPSMKWFVIELRDGRNVRIGVLLTALPEFAAVALSQVSAPTAMDPDTRRVLEETAAGSPPNFFDR